LIIPYGCGRWRDDWLRPDANGRPHCAVPHVVVRQGPGAALRLHDGQYSFQSPPPPDLDTMEQLGFVERYLISRTDPWWPVQACLIEAYFANLRAVVEAARAELDRTLGALGAVFDCRAFAFAAPRPLPRAYIEHPDGTMFGAHCLFWTGENATVIELRGHDSASPARLAMLQGLEGRGMTVLNLETEAVKNGDLPDLFPRFWDGITLPAGPFKALGIEAYADMPYRSSSST